ncbi:hypothetical protein ATE92_1830 [Ulvibacter sp. MAR_2010_11]|uniref:hypothetical protein n=1 Tax=Ulvibacter sp. MAR_2010_11 TaxID=1250229 RepID=UPI000C2C9CE1|nr:hypothetical protein [Ulvibacter sp. MAR_2010_11]PKA83665.1 hypothetical protein ATE92_1830 [Ulvibacter sp. MAR_2010_11]
MKKLLAPAFMLLSIIGFGQVGIGTTNPQETLHINGTLRVTNTSAPTVTSTKISGFDSNGTLREVSLGSRLVLTNNVLETKSGVDYSFGAVTFSVKTNHNTDLLIGEGEANEGKSIIRIFNTSGETVLTGIKAGYDGQSIWLYPQDDKIDLKTNDSGSLAMNRFEENNNNKGKVYTMIQIVYDGARQKWIIMQSYN